MPPPLLDIPEALPSTLLPPLTLDSLNPGVSTPLVSSLLGPQPPQLPLPTALTSPTSAGFTAALSTHFFLFTDESRVFILIFGLYFIAAALLHSHLPPPDVASLTQIEAERALAEKEATKCFAPSNFTFSAQVCFGSLIKLPSSRLLNNTCCVTETSRGWCRRQTASTARFG
jgi:hypothetical protein